MTRFKNCILSCLILLGSLRAYPAALPNTPPDSTDLHLFDFDTPFFGPGADQTFREWEKDFIAFGKKVEQTPVGYIRHVIGWLEINDGNRMLSDYKLSYMANSGIYSYMYLLNNSDPMYWDKHYVRDTYLFTHISRSGENISRLWNNFGYLVEEVISPHIQAGKIERVYVKILLDTWTCITEKKNYRKKLDAIYKKLVSKSPGPDDMLDYVEPLICTDINNRLTQAEGYSYTPNIQWLYTFWVRRYHEGNAEVTAGILESLL
jgi:hypothetical protein